MRDLQVEHFDRHSGFLADLDGFCYRLHDFLAFAPNVARVDPAVLGCGFCELDQFGRSGKTRRWIDERGRHAHRAGAHRLFHHRLHTRELFGVGRPVFAPEHGDARLRGAEVGSEIDADALPLKGGEVIGDPFDGHRRSTFAANGRRHTGAELVLRKAVLEQRAARLIHHVDPAGRDVLAGSIDFLLAAARHDPNAHETAVLDRHVRPNRRVASAVEHVTVADHDVVSRLVLRSTREGEQNECEADELHPHGVPRSSRESSRPGARSCVCRRPSRGRLRPSRCDASCAPSSDVRTRSGSDSPRRPLPSPSPGICRHRG